MEIRRTVGPVTGVTSGAAAFTIIIVWIAGMLGLEVPPEVASAFTTLIVLVAGYLVPPKTVIDSVANRVTRTAYNQNGSGTDSELL